MSSSSGPAAASTRLAEASACAAYRMSWIRSLARSISIARIRRGSPVCHAMALSPVENLAALVDHLRRLQA